jgi:Na+-translocating ferredoxin:NAD+ oxidoreductase RnfD subunit
MSGSNDWIRAHRLAGLRRFAFAISVLTVLGHAVLGFEASWAYPLVALATGYSVTLLIDAVGALADRRRPAFLAGPAELANALLPAHITALAIAMLIYPNERLLPLVFATAAAIGSKAVFRVRAGSGSRHVFNPSNFGIALTLLLFPWVGIAPPYQFTEALGPIGDWGLPAVLVCAGLFLNTRFTRRLPLLAGWVGGFLLQAFARHAFLGASLAGALLPMTGMAFLLFSFYMVTDPPTTPSRPRAQVAFGLAVAAAYGALMVCHVVFGLFFALAAVGTARFAGLSILAGRGRVAAGLPHPRAADARAEAPVYAATVVSDTSSTING